MQIVSCLGDAVVITIIAVHDEGQGLSIRVVVAPQRPNLVLTPHIPHREVDVLVLHSLDVESDRWDSGDVFAGLVSL